MGKYKDDFSFEHRQSEAKRVITNYPDKIPVIIEKYKSCKAFGNLEKRKFIVPSNLTFSQLLTVIRKRVNLKSSQALYMFVGNTIPSMTSQIGDAYLELKEEDGFLYIEINSENFFG